VHLTTSTLRSQHFLKRLPMWATK